MRSILFTISKLEFIGSGKFMVAGRNCEDDLRLGDTLTIECEQINESRKVVVTEMEMYSKPQKSIPPGFTAGLFFENSIAGHFALGGKLVGSQPD